MYTNLQMDTNEKKHILHPELSYAVVGACFDVHNELGRFAREKQYGDLLETRFIDLGLRYEREFGLGDSGNILDFLIEEKVVLELKTVRHLSREYYRQIQNYLQQARIELGLLVNFSDVYLQPRRIIRIDTKEKHNTNLPIATNNSDSNSQPLVDLSSPHSDSSHSKSFADLHSPHSDML